MFSELVRKLANFSGLLAGTFHAVSAFVSCANVGGAISPRVCVRGSVFLRVQSVRSEELCVSVFFQRVSYQMIGNAAVCLHPAPDLAAREPASGPVSHGDGRTERPKG